MLKLSRFNCYISRPAGLTAIYNTFSGGLCIVHDSFAGRLLRFGHNGGMIPELAWRALPALRESGILIDAERDELAEYRFRRNREKYSTEDARFLLYTATACNFKCPYCYQAASRRENEGLMTESTALRVIGFMQRLIEENGCRRVTVGIYGGEPLLNPRVSGMIMSEMASYCREKGIFVQYSLTTNCYHLAALKDEPVIRLATAINVVLDGPADLHNRVRCTRAGKPSYSKIMRGLSAALRLGKILGIRIHYDNIDGSGLLRILDDLAAAGVDRSKKVSIYLMNIEDVPELGSQACSYKTDPQTLGRRMQHVRELAKAIRNHRLLPLFNWEYTLPDKPLPPTHTCGFDRVMSFAVNFDGALRKCCGFVGERLRTGTLGDSGAATLTDSYFETMVREASERQVCRRCVYLPVCGGGCVLNDQPPETLDDCRNLRELFYQRILSYVESSAGEHLRYSARAGNR